MRARQKGHLKKKLRRKLEERLGPAGEGETGRETVFVVCVGDDCAARDETRATFAAITARVAALDAGRADRVRAACHGCLKVCKKGPIVALLPEGRLYRRVDAADAAAWVDAVLAGDRER